MTFLKILLVRSQSHFGSKSPSSIPIKLFPLSTCQAILSHRTFVLECNFLLSSLSFFFSFLTFVKGHLQAAIVVYNCLLSLLSSDF